MEIDLRKTLKGTLSANQQERQQATEALVKASEQNFGGYLGVLCGELVNEGLEGHLRVAAGLSVKNSLVARDAGVREGLRAKWHGLSGPVRLGIKQLALQGLGAKDGQAGIASAQVVAAIATIEMAGGVNGWPDLLTHLLGNMTDGSVEAANVRRATLEALGFVCEQVEEVGVLAAQSSSILTVIANGLREGEVSVAVRTAAARALLNAVHFIRPHIESPAECAIIMQVVCEASISPAETLAVASLQVLNELLRLYYEHLGQFLGEGVAQMAISLVAGGGKPDAVVLQAVEFWSTLAEIEADLAYYADEDGGEGESHKFCSKFAESLLPPLLALLERQPSEDAQDDWCPSMAASTCLGLLAELLQDALICPTVTSFISSRLTSPEWRGREAGVMALGSVLDGPSPHTIAPLISTHLQQIVQLLAQDPSVAVQDSAAWSIGRICDFHLDTVPHPAIPVLLQALTHCLTYPPRVATNCAWSLMTICTHLGDEEEGVEHSEVSAEFMGIVQALLAAADREDGDEANLRAAAYQSLAAVLLNAPADCKPILASLLEPTISRLEAALHHLHTAALNADDRHRLHAILSHLATLLQSLLRKTGAPADAPADRIMAVLLAILTPASTSTSQSAAELEDLLLLLGVMAAEGGERFVRFATFVVPPLAACLGRVEETSLCSVSVGVVGDIARALGPLLQPHLPALLPPLLSGLTSPALHRSVKPHIIAAIGDIILAVGSAFTPLLDPTAALLAQASTISIPDTDDLDDLDWIASLRESLLEAYTCLVQGIRQDSNGEALLPHLPALLTFCQLVIQDKDRTEPMVRSIAGLLGDLAQAFPSIMASTISAPWMASFFSQPLHSAQLAPATLQVLQWAQLELSKLSSSSSS